MPCSGLLSISPDEVNDELRGTLDVNDQATMAWLNRQLAKAERKLFALCPATETRIRQGDAQTKALAKDLVIEAVARLARVEPDSVGYRSESEDGYSYTVDPLTRSGNLWFPDSDLVQLGCGAKALPFTPRSARFAQGTAWHGGFR
ncbi:Gp19/Gp15/Gp42 family protein [Rothia sp. P4278]|uniref:Gp19/Gp15/Gp42 family protein n=1 Tax=Rothia sp. P4278 TaxID=3402658 RepID=UPI003AE8F878